MLPLRLRFDCLKFKYKDSLITKNVFGVSTFSYVLNGNGLGFPELYRG